MSTYAMTATFNQTKTQAVSEDTLSSRLVYALNYLRISQSEVARRVGIKPQVIQYLCTNHAKKSKFAYEIALALEINPTWLIAGKGSADFKNTNNTVDSSSLKVPLLDLNTIASWLNQTNESLSQPQEFTYAAAPIAAHSYAVRITDTSMIPRFEVNTILVVDPDLKPENGDFVVVKILHQEQPIIRQLLYRCDTYYLAPANSAMYKEIELSNEDKVLGVVRQIYYEFER